VGKSLWGMFFGRDPEVIEAKQAGKTARTQERQSGRTTRTQERQNAEILTGGAAGVDWKALGQGAAGLGALGATALAGPAGMALGGTGLSALGLGVDAQGDPVQAAMAIKSTPAASDEDGDGIVDQVADFASENPVIAGGVALGAAALLGKLLKVW
jgi:hypothetical protein